MPGPPNGAIQICNLALDVVGQAVPINSIDAPVTDTEFLLSRHYDQCRQETLREYPWHFATAMAQCTRVGTPLSDYRDEYQLPSDFIRLLSVGGQIEEWQRQDYRINGQTILINNSLPTGITPTLYNITETTTDTTVVTGTPPNQTQTETITTVIEGTLVPPGSSQINTGTANASSINIRYIFDCTNIPQWVPDAKRLFSLILARDIAYMVTKQEEVVKRIAQLIADLRPSAYAVDGQENTPKRIQYSQAINKRRFQLNSSIVASPYTILP
jgi:hypothetical protein